jgi:NtrC-family two-component system response regulator AlgB
VPEADLQSSDPKMIRLIEMAKRVAPFDSPALLRGENGTGKGVMARAIHAWSDRADGPFVTINCPSLSADLLESELFGHVRGAFTSAIRDAAGKVATAEGGTLFLDEIGDLPLPLQPKLLRFLQERKYERVGDTKTRTANVRVLAATNRDLELAVKSGTFREDLYYRLNVFEMTLPPLRDRSDLLTIADHYVKVFTYQTSRKLAGFTREAQAAIARHRWSGNLRELRNAIERAVILADGPEIGLADLPEKVSAQVVGEVERGTFEVGGFCTLESLEVEHLRRVLAKASSLEEAAKILGIDPSTLYRKRKQHGL